MDNNGLPGALGRCYSCATVENKSDINELIELVAELNAKSASKSYSIPASVVVGETSGVVLDAKSLEVETAVVAPAAQSFEVETEAFVPSYNVTYIRPFRF